MKNKNFKGFFSVLTLIFIGVLVSVMTFELDVTAEAESMNIEVNDGLILKQDFVKAEFVSQKEITEQKLLNFVITETKLNKEESKFIVDICEEKGVDIFLLMGIMYKESRFDPTVTGGSGEMGLCQLMSVTAEHYSNILGYEFDKAAIYDPMRNVDLATEHLKYLKNLYDGNEHMMLTAYNRGSGGLANYIASGHSNYEQPWMSSYSVEALEIAETFKEEFEKID